MQKEERRQKAQNSEEFFYSYTVATAILFFSTLWQAKRDLQVVDSPAQSDNENNIMSEDEALETNQGVHSESEASDIDSDEERKRYDEQLETFLDQAYELVYVTVKEDSTKQRKRAKLAVTGADSELWK
ncbi:hypothetical protein KI387_013686, partial [Taxus chinensis]